MAVPIVVQQAELQCVLTYLCVHSHCSCRRLNLLILCNLRQQPVPKGGDIHGLRLRLWRHDVIAAFFCLQGRLNSHKLFRLQSILNKRRVVERHTEPRDGGLYRMDATCNVYLATAAQVRSPDRSSPPVPL